MWASVSDAIGWAAYAGFRGEDDTPESEEAGQCQVLRCIFGNPFHELRPVDAPLLIRDLARAAYGSRNLPEGTLDPGHLAVLCDALEEIGFAEPALIDHLRVGKHWPGCHVIDALLDKS